jgi:hypothetical protein
VIGSDGGGVGCMCVWHGMELRGLLDGIDLHCMIYSAALWRVVCFIDRVSRGVCFNDRLVLIIWQWLVQVHGKKTWRVKKVQTIIYTAVTQQALTENAAQICP